MLQFENSTIIQFDNEKKKSEKLKIGAIMTVFRIYSFR
jgi:hypothetical protein